MQKVSITISEKQFIILLSKPIRSTPGTMAIIRRIHVAASTHPDGRGRLFSAAAGAFPPAGLVQGAAGTRPRFIGRSGLELRRLFFHHKGFCTKKKPPLWEAICQG